MWRLKLKETTYDKISGGHVLIIILGITVLAFLMLASVAGAVPFAYITNYDDNTTSVIDIATNTVTSTVPVGIRPCGVAVSPDGTKVYVANDDSNNISVIDATTSTVTSTVPVGHAPYGVAVSPDGTKVYVANYGSNTTSVIDTATNNVIASVPVGWSPVGVTIAPDGTKVYVANLGSSNVSIIDTATNTVTDSVNVGIAPCGVAVTPDGSKLYVTNAGDNTTSVIDTITNNVTVTVAVGKTPITLGQFIGGPVTASNTSRDTETDCKGIEDYVPDYAGGAVIHIKNRVGNDIVVSWAKEGSQKAVFQVNIPAGQTRTVTAPSGSYEEYIRAGCSWYIVTDGHIVVESGYEYSLEYYTVVDNNTIVYDGTGFKQIPDSQAPKI